MSWVSPTGHNDPSNDWTDEAQAYDGNTGTEAYTTTQGSYLELTLSSPIECDKIRIFCADSSNGSELDSQQDEIDVYYSGGWHNIYDGTTPRKQWVEKEVGSVQTISKARVKTDHISYTYRVYEFEFWRIEGVRIPAVVFQHPAVV